MAKNVFPVSSEVIASALKDGIIVKDASTGTWKPFIGIVILEYIVQFEQFALLYTGRNPQDAKLAFLAEYKKSWDLKKPLKKED